MCVQCWYYDVTELTDPVRFTKAMEALPWETRREKILRYRMEKDRCLSLGAGLLAAYALRQAGASDLTTVLLENGKPVLRAHPEIHFNLSHSGSLAVCAVSDCPVGVDVETIRVCRQRVAERCFQPKELAWLDSAPDRDLAFVRLWTRKESFLKRTGEGLSVSLRSFSVLPDDESAAGIAWAERQVTQHWISVCTADGQTVSFRQIRKPF